MSEKVGVRKELLNNGRHVENGEARNERSTLSVMSIVHVHQHSLYLYAAGKIR